MSSSLLAWSLLGQDAPVGPRALAPSRSVMANAGLHATPDGAALRGGGRDYRVLANAQGLRFEPALGAGVPTLQHLQLAPLAVARGAAAMPELATHAAPTHADLRAEWARAPGVTERCDVRVAGAELSWRFAAPLPGSGDLVVRYAVDTSLPSPVVVDGGLRFAGEHGGVHVGGVTGIDANGAVCAGGIAFRDGVLELSLPAAFVDRAAYPIVLDPVLGAVVNVSSGLTYVDGEPDAAYDATTNRWLVVWERTFSATSVEIRGQLVTSGGALTGGTLFFASTGEARAPRVANLGSHDRFGVLWRQSDAGTHSIRLQAVTAAAGTLSAPLTIASSATTPFPACDLGCQSEASIGSNRGFLVVFESDADDRIYTVRAWIGAGGVLQHYFAAPMFSDTPLGVAYERPTVSRTATLNGLSGFFLVVARRRGVLLGNTAIVAQVTDTVGALVGNSFELETAPNGALDSPEVDGYGGRWVAVWERDGTSPSFDAVRARTIDYTLGFAPVLGPTATFGDALARAYSPTVGYAPGRTWIGYRRVTTLGTPNTTTLRLAAVDSASCTSCADTFAVSFPDGPRIVAAPMTSGGVIDGEDALVVFHDSIDDVNAQRVRNYGTSGSWSSLGGGCGSAGTQAFNHDPGIGSSSLRCTLSGIPASAIATIFNFAPTASGGPCGPCVWNALTVTQTPVISGGTAFVQFPVPCLPTLVGAQFETQWTTIDPGQMPCPVFPGLAMSHRVLLTIGQ